MRYYLLLIIKRRKVYFGKHTTIITVVSKNPSSKTMVTKNKNPNMSYKSKHSHRCRKIYFSVPNLDFQIKNSGKNYFGHNSLGVARATSFVKSS